MCIRDRHCSAQVLEQMHMRAPSACSFASIVRTPGFSSTVSYNSVMREVIAELYETVELKPGVRKMCIRDRRRPAGQHEG